VTEYRWDETWHRLRDWTNGQAPSERLAAQVLLSEGFESLDPSHPLGGRDLGKDALCRKNGRLWVMGVYFPHRQQTLKEIQNKFQSDAEGARRNDAFGFAFVTNQELTLSERETLTSLSLGQIEIYHLERLTAILDNPGMESVRKQFLGIDCAEQSRGGRGGDAKVGGHGTAVGGSGGAGGVGGSGGDGGRAEVNGDGFAVGGEGGEAGHADRGGRGGRGPLEILGAPNRQLADGTWLWDFGRGGDGGTPGGATPKSTPKDSDDDSGF
jgi:hypothetical protein